MRWRRHGPAIDPLEVSDILKSAYQAIGWIGDLQEDVRAIRRLLEEDDEEGEEDRGYEPNG